MLLVENALSVGQVNLVLRLLRPRQAEDPVQVMPANAVLRRRRWHLLQAIQFLRRDRLRLGWHGRLLELLPQHADLAGVGV